MRKILTIFILMILSFILISCNGSKSNYNVTVLDKSFNGNTYNYVIEIEGDHTEIELKSISYSTISEIFDLLEIQTNTTAYLNVVFQYNNKDFITLKYQINESIESPGLKLIKEVIH